MSSNRINSSNNLKRNNNIIHNLKYLIVNKITCVVSRPQIVQVVSILDVPIKFGSTSFQSNDVSGAQKSEFLFC